MNDTMADVPVAKRWRVMLARLRHKKPYLSVEEYVCMMPPSLWDAE